MTNLKPCHCNTTPILQHTREAGFYIHCPTCQSYTHGVQWSEAEALAVWNNRVDPRVRIDPERPETLPETHWRVLLTVRLIHAIDKDNNLDVYPASRRKDGWYTHEGRISEDDFEAIAWQPWPDPAPYPNEEG